MVNKENTSNKEQTSLTVSRQIPLAKIDTLLPEGLSFEGMQETLQELDSIQFPRIRIVDGRFFFSQDDEEGTTEFEGVVLAFSKQNTYWASGFDSKNTSPPECYSLDGKTGTKYGSCKSCQYNQFGSATNGGRGKACRNQIKLYIQLDGKAIPMTMLISPINISAFSQNYMVDTLAQRGLHYWRCKTKFSIGKKKGEQFGRIKCELIGEFRNDDLTQISKMREFWRAVIDDDTKTLETGTAESSTSSEPVESSPAKAAEARPVSPKPSTKSTYSDDDPPF